MKSKLTAICPKCRGIAIPVGSENDEFQDYWCISSKRDCGFRFKRWK